MHIGLRSSGGGGEYELVGQHGSFHSSELTNWKLRWDLPGVGLRKTKLWIDPGQSGKSRLRAYEANWPQIGRQIAGLLLFPDPVRERDAVAKGPDILRKKKYHLAKIIPRSDLKPLDPETKTITIRPTYVEVTNNTDSELCGFESRWNRVQAVHRAGDTLSADLANAVREHCQSLQDQAIGRRTISAATRISTVLFGAEPSYEKGRDVLPVLEQLAKLVPEEVVPEEANLPSLEEIDEDEIGARLKATSDWRLERSSGSRGAAFSREVRDAYNHTCMFCGLRFPGEDGIKSGVDAAHILPWAEYDLDVVTNGLCLCKIHHWAFDQAVLSLRHANSKYVVEETPRLATFDVLTQRELSRTVGEIDRSRLPRSSDSWPSPRYLNLNYEMSLSVADRP